MSIRYFSFGTGIHPVVLIPPLVQVFSLVGFLKYPCSVIFPVPFSPVQVSVRMIFINSGEPWCRGAPVVRIGSSFSSVCDNLVENVRVLEPEDGSNLPNVDDSPGTPVYSGRH